MHDLVLEKKANEFRTLHGFSNNDCLRLRSLLQKLNVLTVFRPLKDSFSGMAIKIGEGDGAARFVLINSDLPLGKQHFTICHELYHLYIQESFTARTCITGNYSKADKEEYNADVFASYFLLPDDGIKSMIPDKELKKNRITLKTILKVEQYFSCSRAALLYRLKKLGIIDSDGYEQFKHYVMKGALEHGYSVDLYKDGNHQLVLGDYGTLAKELYDKEKISETHYYSLLLDLGMNSEELKKIYNEDGSNELIYFN